MSTTRKTLEWRILLNSFATHSAFVLIISIQVRRLKTFIMPKQMVLHSTAFGHFQNGRFFPTIYAQHAHSPPVNMSDNTRIKQLIK